MRKGNPMSATPRVIAAAACFLLVLTSGARASLPEQEDAVEEQSAADILPEGPGMKAKTVPVSPTAKRQRPDMGGKASGRKQKPAIGGEGGQPAGKRREYKVKGATVTIRESQVDGTEYFCLHPRRRMWVDGQGWVIRRTTSCF